jgi:phage protein U
MAETMMALGSFRFSVCTAEYQSLATSMAWRWAKKDRYQRKPGKQFHGPDSTTKTLDITVCPDSRDELLALERLRELGDAGKPLRMVAGSAVVVSGALTQSGADMGLWVIESLSVTDDNFMRDGTPLLRKGTLVISEYGEDGES